MTPRERVSQTNSGQFSVTVLKAANPAASAEPGPQESGYLNLLEAAKVHGGSSSYHPSITGRYPGDERDGGVMVTIVMLALDGMLCGVGQKTDEFNMRNVGALGHSVDFEEAQRLLAMNDDERRAWLLLHPYIYEYVEVMAMSGCGKFNGHVGFEFSGVGGGAEAVRDTVDRYIPLQRLCYCCLKLAFTETASIASTTPGAGWTNAKKRCDKYCEGCMAAETAHVLDPSKPSACKDHPEREGVHWTATRCSACVKSSSVCHNLSMEAVSMDCCGSNEAYQAQVLARKPGMFGAGTHVVIGDLAHMIKSMVSGCRNYFLRHGGVYVGIRQIKALFNDAQDERRERVRCAIHHRDLEAKNKFDVQGHIDTISKEVQQAMLSDEERAAGKPVNILITLAPEKQFWSENLPSAIDTPSGVVFHRTSGLLFFIDKKPNAIRALRFGHTPAYNDLLYQAGSRVSFIDLGLVHDQLYITDELNHCLWTLDIKSVCTPSRSSHASETVAGMGEDGPRGASLSAAARLVKVELRQDVSGTHPHHVSIRGLYGVTFAQAGEVGYATDFISRSVLQLRMINPTTFVVKQLHHFEERSMAPRGIAVLSATELVVAAGSTIFVLARAPNASGVVECRVVHTAEPPPAYVNADAGLAAGAADASAVADALAAAEALAEKSRTIFCGVAVNDDRTAVRVSSDQGVHALWELIPHAVDLATPWTCTVIAGGNREYSADIKTQEGTASATRLWRPTFVCYALNSFVFSHSGSGSIVMVTDLHAFATVVVPAMRKMVEAAGLSATDNATTLHGE
jgi:hypothetical protein